MPFINTSGSGALIIDAEVARKAWTGFYVRSKPRSREMPDLETSDGVGWMIHDVFDLKHPVTDYDRLCAHHGRRPGPLVNNLGKDTFVSISNGNDSFGWWPRVGVFTGNRSRSPSPAEVKEARFSRLGAIELLSGRVRLMNPCLHGADPDLEGSDQVISIDIGPGRYVVEHRSGPHADLFVRLRRVPRGAPRPGARLRDRRRA
jgi:hypothetical protein